MKTLAILPVKSFGAAKQRLAESLGAAGSAQAADTIIAPPATIAGHVRDWISHSEERWSAP